MNFINDRYRIPIILAAIKFILPYLLQDPLYELHRDEYLYLAEADHLDWGFMEVPPLLSVFASVTQLLGNGFFWVKFWPSLFGALTVLVVCEMVTEMGGRKFAQFLASMGIITGAFLRTHFLFQPGFLEIFWWSLLALLIIKYINTRQSKYILFLGVAAGLAWLSKYSIIFFAVGILAGFLLTPNRRIFLRKHIYWAALIALLVALPNIAWQYSHRWPVIFHMKELRETQLQFISPATFLIDQVIMLLPCFFIWFGGLLWLLLSKTGKSYRAIAWMFITVVLLLIISSGKSYYSLGAYPMLLAAGGVWLEKLTAYRLRWLRFVSIALLLVIFLPLIPVLLPVWEPAKLADYYKRSGFDKVGILKWEDLKNHPLPQDFSDMLGWKELSEKVSVAFGAMPDSIKTKTLLYCRNYGQAGAITYYGNGLPQVNTNNASFLFWMPDSYRVKNILLVARRQPGKEDLVFQQFEKKLLVDSVEHPLSREYGTKIFLFLNGNSKVDAMIEEDIRKQKEQFRR